MANITNDHFDHNILRHAFSNFQLKELIGNKRTNVSFDCRIIIS